MEHNYPKLKSWNWYSVRVTLVLLWNGLWWDFFRFIYTEIWTEVFSRLWSSIRDSLSQGWSLSQYQGHSTVYQSYLQYIFMKIKWFFFFRTLSENKRTLQLVYMFVSEVQNYFAMIWLDVSVEFLVPQPCSCTCTVVIINKLRTYIIVIIPYKLYNTRGSASFFFPAALRTGFKIFRHGRFLSVILFTWTHDNWYIQ